MPRPTPFHPRTEPLCESYDWQEWSGFLTANSYEMNPMREFYAIRTAAALIDVSPLFKYHIGGPDAEQLLNRVVTRDVSKCRVGQVMYTTWCDDDGKIIDDGTIARLAPDLFRLTAADPNLRWLEDNAAGLDVTLEDVTESIAALSVQGPLSRTVLQTQAADDLSDLRYFHLIHTHVAGVPATITRTGYTGDLGYEVWIGEREAPGARDALHVWDALVECGQPYKLRPAGQTAMDIARIEAGLLLIQVDFTSARKTLYEVQKATPYELGLGWTVALDKGAFVGRRALAEEHARGPAWRTVGLVVDYESLEALHARFGMPVHVPDQPWWDDRPVYNGSSQIGRATCGVWSPILKAYIALARLRPAYAQPGTPVGLEVTVEAVRGQAAARVVALPFYDPPRKRR